MTTKTLLLDRENKITELQNQLLRFETMRSSELSSSLQNYENREIQIISKLEEVYNQK